MSTQYEVLGYPSDTLLIVNFSGAGKHESSRISVNDQVTLAQLDTVAVQTLLSKQPTYPKDAVDQINCSDMTPTEKIAKISEVMNQYNNEVNAFKNSAGEGSFTNEDLILTCVRNYLIKKHGFAKSSSESAPYIGLSDMQLTSASIPGAANSTKVLYVSGTSVWG